MIRDVARPHDVVADGAAILGIELGSTRIKACLIAPDGTMVAAGSHRWANRIVDGRWTYALADVWAGLQDCYAALTADVASRYGVTPTTFRAIGVSAMMHGYLAFDERDDLLVPFRTWRNTSTGPAAAELSAAFGRNVPLRWSVAHYYQALLDEEDHVSHVSTLTTLAGYVHTRLTGRRVLGVGDASGMFPIDASTGDYDAALLDVFDDLAPVRRHGVSLRPLLPAVLPAGEDAGRLTAEGAALLDPSGVLQPGIPLCPPEGDAGTGMVATNSVAPRTANVSVGTSIFAMVVLERPWTAVHADVDVVTTPAGDPVAMVHCNNGASEIDAWTTIFAQFAAASGAEADRDAVFRVLLEQALDGAADAGGLLAYNHLSGEPIAGLTEGRPLFVRTPMAEFTLANFMRAQVYSAFATLSMGMQVLTREGVDVDVVSAHGGVFRTEGVAQRLLSAVVDAPVAVGTASGEGGAWGMALLAGYLAHARASDLGTYLDDVVFADAEPSVVHPVPEDVAGFLRFMERYRAGLAIESAAARVL